MQKPRDQIPATHLPAVACVNEHGLDCVLEASFLDTLSVWKDWAFPRIVELMLSP